MRTIDDMVRQEVIYCVSTLITELTSSDIMNGDWGDHLEELRSGKPDYESAALEAGYMTNRNDKWVGETEQDIFDSAEDLCNTYSIEPESYSKPLEFWIVSDWLADELLAQGETVVKDFMGMDIWGRCTGGLFGTSITMDGVIKRIHEESQARVKAMLDNISFSLMVRQHD
jgi:hypothetical protein